MDLPRRHRACNACRSRKVRCDPGSEKRCRECEHLNLRCEYPEPAHRAKRQVRGTHIQGHKAGHTATVDAPWRPLQALDHRDGSEALSPTSSSFYDPTEFFISLLHDYGAYVYPFFPIITVSEARLAADEMHHDREARAFVYALCAATISLAHNSAVAEADEPAAILECLTKAMDALPGVVSIDSITIRRIVLIEFIHTTLAGLGRFEPANHYLRQSISMVQALDLSDARKLELYSPPERARRERLYYLIFIHERYFALFHHHVISMTGAEWLPQMDETIPHQVSRGFNQIIGLFLHIDMDMITSWLAVTNEDINVDTEWIQKKHREIEAEPAGSAEQLVGLWGMQQADLIISKHWLRMLLWQIALSKRLLSSASDEQGMSLLFPVGVSMQLRALIGQVSRQEISIHGSGIQQKLFEMTDIIAGVILAVANIDPEGTQQRVDEFTFLYDFWRTLPRLNATQLEILQDKDQKVRSLLHV